MAVIKRRAISQRSHEKIGDCEESTAKAVKHYPRLRYERDTNCHAYSGRFVTAFDLTYYSVCVTGGDNHGSCLHLFPFGQDHR